MKEKDLVEKYISIQFQNNKSIKILREFGYRQKKIDVIEYDPNSEIPLHGIEFKIKNWKIGFQQCLGNRDFIPKNSLAIFHKFVKNVDIETLKLNGIGLISLGENRSKQLVKPKMSSLLNSKKHNFFFRNLLKNLITNPSQ